MPSPTVARHRQHIAVCASLCLGALLLAGCASVSVEATREHLPKSYPLPAPGRIFVARYEADPAVFEVDRSEKELRDFVLNARERLARALADRLGQMVAPAQTLPDGVLPPLGNHWLVTGDFDSVRQGSRALRMAFGFGFGRTKIETTTRVYDLSGGVPTLIFSISTTGGSGAMPGAVGAISPMVFTPVGAAGIIMNTVGGAHSGLAFDTARTAKEITAALSEFAWQRGMIPGENATAPKRKGKLPNRIFYSVPEDADGGEDRSGPRQFMN